MAWNETQSGKELPNYPSISHTTVGGWAVLVIGALGIGVCTMCVLIWQGVIVTKANAPLWVIGVAGGVFGLCGLAMVIYGIGDLRRQSRKKLAAQTHPSEPWRGDYDWTPAGSLRGMSSRDSRLWWKHLIGPVVVIMMATISNWITIDEWGQGFHSWFLAFMSVVMNLVVLIVLGLFIRRVVMWLRYGSPRIVFDRVPIRPGDTFNARLMTRGLGHAQRIEMSLREVNEEYIKRRTQHSQRPKEIVKCAELRVFSVVVDDVRSQLAGDGTLAVGFEVPSDAASNALSDRPARFWDLEVRGVMRGVDFVHRFAVPVYAQD